MEVCSMLCQNSPVKDPPSTLTCDLEESPMQRSLLLRDVLDTILAVSSISFSQWYLSRRSCQCPRKQAGGRQVPGPTTHCGLFLTVPRRRAQLSSHALPTRQKNVLRLLAMTARLPLPNTSKCSPKCNVRLLGRENAAARRHAGTSGEPCRASAPTGPPGSVLFRSMWNVVRTWMVVVETTS